MSRNDVKAWAVTLAALSLAPATVAGWRAVTRRDVVRCPLLAAPTTVLLLVVERVPLWRFESPASEACDALGSQGVAATIVRLSRDTLPARAQRLGATIAGTLAASPSVRRLVFAGHAGAAPVVAALALDAALRAKAGLDQVELRGVVALGGRFDPADVPPRPVRPTAPRFLVLAGELDTSTAAARSRRFARALEARGVEATFFTLPGLNGESIADFARDSTLTRGVAAFARGEAVPGIDPRWTAWPPPRQSTRAFVTDSSLERSYPISPRVHAALRVVLGDDAGELRSYDARYQAVDLMEFLARQPAGSVGAGDHLVITNARGERVFLTRREVQAVRPRIMVGLGDEQNLFRLQGVHRPRLRYSWIADERPLPWMVRPVGGMLVFPESTPSRRVPPTATATLTPTSFRWQRADPLARARALPDSVRSVLFGPSGCLHCHSFRGEGASSRHVRFEGDSAPDGGVALPLEQYPEAVLHAFLFDQDRIAARFGVGPLRVERRLAQQLEALVRTARHAAR